MNELRESACILIREGKPLYPLLTKLRARRSVRVGIVKVYVEKECRKIKFVYNMQGVPKKRDKSIAPSIYRRILIIHTPNSMIVNKLQNGVLNSRKTQSVSRLNCQ
jgi:hypothetical protein